MTTATTSTQPTSMRTIETTIFPPLPGSSCGGGGCSCGPRIDFSSAGLDPTKALQQTLDKIQRNLGYHFNVEIMQYTTRAGIQRAIEKLNAALKATGSDFMISDMNLVEVLSTATPILIADDIIVSSGAIPSPDELSKYFESLR